MKSVFSHFSLLLLLCPSIAFGQKDMPNVKFGAVTAADFAPQFYPVDSSAGAVYLFDVGSSAFDGNKTGYFSVNYERHTRIRLLKKNAFDDVATIKIPLFQKKGIDQKIESLEAVTYNLEGGKIVTTKVDNSAIFKDKDGDVLTEKFAFPNIKEGSIIELSYTISSTAYWYLFPWHFQRKYPLLYTQYSVEVPALFNFVFLKQGFVPFNVDTTQLFHKNYVVAEKTTEAYETVRTYTVSATVAKHTWAAQNVFPLKEENYTTTMENHLSEIEFQLSEIRRQDEPADTFTHTWGRAAKEMMGYSDFGLQLNGDNDWLKDDVTAAKGTNSSPLDAAKAIYKYMQAQYTLTKGARLYLSQPLRKTWQSKTGNVTDINMLLVDMLRTAGYTAYPVVLSTRNNGIANNVYPIMDKFNYTVVQLKLMDGTNWLLDASNPGLGFGQLPPYCYNGYARVMSENDPASITLSADSLTETKTMNVFITNTDNGIGGEYVAELGNAALLNMRDEAGSKYSTTNFFASIKKNYPFDVEISNTSVDSLANPGAGVSVKYDFDFKAGDNIFYFPPMLTEAIKENPFKSAERLYPVEKPFCEDQTYTLNMEIPKGYRVDELPKSAKIMLNETDGMFEYTIAADKQRVQLRCRLVIKKANFAPEDYKTLRDFYTFIVTKEAEQVVFKKL